jgi:O-phosphoseryl-tRNA(Cys) synthetase
MTKNTSYIAKNLKLKDFCKITAENFCKSVVVQKNRNRIGTFDLLGNNCGQPLTKVWETPISSLGVIGKEKTIKRIEMSTNVDLTVMVISEKETKKVKIKKSKGLSGENLSVRGKEFKFIFSTNSSKCEICSPQITFSYL